jgi:large subunit ribosomal protein L10
MQGHIGIVFTKDDFVTAAKLLCKFEEESEKIEILSGFIEGQLYDKQSVIKLSKLPSMNELRAQFIGLLEAPMSQTLGVFDALLTSVIHCLENKAKL